MVLRITDYIAMHGTRITPPPPLGNKDKNDTHYALDYRDETILGAQMLEVSKELLIFIAGIPSRTGWLFNVQTTKAHKGWVCLLPLIIQCRLRRVNHL